MFKLIKPIACLTTAIITGKICLHLLLPNGPSGTVQILDSSGTGYGTAENETIITGGSGTDAVLFLLACIITIAATIEVYIVIEYIQEEREYKKKRNHK